MIPPFRELNVWGIYERDDQTRVVKSDRVVEVGSLLGSSVSDEWAAVNRRHLFLAGHCNSFSSRLDIPASLGEGILVSGFPTASFPTVSGEGNGCLISMRSEADAARRGGGGRRAGWGREMCRLERHGARHSLVPEELVFPAFTWAAEGGPGFRLQARGRAGRCFRGRG